MRLSYSGQVCLPSKEDTVSSNLISRSSGQQTRKGFVAIQKNSPFFLPRYLMGVSRVLFYQSSPVDYYGVDFGSYAYQVTSGGDFDGSNWDIGSSYGRSSPDLFGDSSKDGWRIASSGSVGSLGNHYVYDSYG